MSLTVEDGSGLASADSYLSVADADAYHAAHTAPAEWTEAEESEKERVLRLGTQFLDLAFGGRWLGCRVQSTQALAWPRYGVEDADGYVVSSNAVPQGVKDACAEAALRALSAELMADETEPAIKSESVKVGPVTESKEYLGGKNASPNYRRIKALLRGLIVGGGNIRRG